MKLDRGAMKIVSMDQNKEREIANKDKAEQSAKSLAEKDKSLEEKNDFIEFLKKKDRAIEITCPHFQARSKVFASNATKAEEGVTEYRVLW